MKKAFLIFFVLVAAIGACFAATGDYLKLTTTIKAEKPEFSMEGKAASVVVDPQTGEPVVSNPVSGTPEGASVRVGSPVDGPVKVEIVVKQSNFARYKGKFDITVEAEKLSNTNDADQTTGTPTVEDLVSNVTNGTDFAVATSDSANKVTLAMDYKTGSKVESCTVATWKFVWAHAPNLAPGTYEGTVTITYEAK